MRWLGIVLAMAGLALVVWALVEAPRALIEVISRGAESTADKYEVELVRVGVQFLIGVGLTIFGIRIVRQQPD
jgi:hypothetical protein